jgi:hypothetical protein
MEENTDTARPVSYKQKKIQSEIQSSRSEMREREDEAGLGRRRGGRT